MANQAKVRAELEEQRCLIEQQQVEIQRQRRHIQLQARLIQSIQAELEALKGTVQRVAPIRGNRGNGNGRHAARALRPETLSSSDQA
jgi:type II secretory pathway component PulJ